MKVKSNLRDCGGVRALSEMGKEEAWALLCCGACFMYIDGLCWLVMFGSGTDCCIR